MQLKRRHIPSIKLIQTLIETAFFASMRSEESRKVVCTLALVHADDPAGQNPQVIRPQRRSFTSFDRLLPFDIRNLVKLSQAAPPWGSCIAVCGVNDRLYICGLFDQEVHYRNSLNREEGDRFDRPGIFQVEITGIGSLAVHDGWYLVATLNQNTLVQTFHDVFHGGPIAIMLAKLLKKHESTIRLLLKKEGVIAPTWLWKQDLLELWVRNISRILINIKRSGHGGAVLLTLSPTIKHLKIKYQIHYSKLEQILPEHIAAEIRENAAWEEIHEGIEYEKKREVPAQLYFSETVAANDQDDSIKGELGCVNFIASLARVDGCVLLSSGLTVKGFGVEITCRNDPPKVFIAGDVHASISKLRKLDFSHFGTRHRSMMRYCYSSPGSIGFVVSQDGDVRAITRVDRKVVLWENIRLQDVLIARTSVAE